MSEFSVQGLRALVTGASGFLGSHLCERLLQSGAEVHATSRVCRDGDKSRLRWWQSGLTEFGLVRELLEEIRPEVIFHLAGRVTAAPELGLVLPTFSSLLGSTVNVLAAATTVGCRRVVVTGSLTEPESGLLDVVPSSPYATAKWAGAAYARMFHKLYRTPVVILRLFMTYGPGQHREKIIPYVIESLSRGRPPQLSSGRWKADWVYVDDVIDGFVLAAARPSIEGCTFDLGSGTLTSTREVVRRLIALYGPQVEPSFGALRDRPDEQVRAADIAPAREKLGWEPNTSLDEGLARTVRWHQDRLARLHEEQ
jgi:UDP-glucose 4-epimerase